MEKEKVIEALKAIIDMPIRWVSICPENQEITTYAAILQMKVQEDAVRALKYVNDKS